MTIIGTIAITTLAHCIIVLCFLDDIVIVTIYQIHIIGAVLTELIGLVTSHMRKFFNV